VSLNIIFKLDALKVSLVKIKSLSVFLFYSTVLALLSACNQADDSLRSQYREIAWQELKPEDEKQVIEPLDLQTLEIVNNGYLGDSGSDLQGLDGGYDGAPPQPYSYGFVEEINGQKVRVPGFIVPVEFDDGNLVSEFFLVPYFGACFHKPPPPPNQTIYVSSNKPIEYQSIYDPVWVMGVIKTEQRANEIASAAYSLDIELLEPYFE